MGVIAVQAGPADRTLSDTTPTGIGLKPTGEQLLGMESEARSWKEEFGHEVRREADEITDVAENWGDLGARLCKRPPANSHTLVPARQPEIPPSQHHGVEGGQIAIAVFAMGLVALEANRRIKDRINVSRAKQL
jgi:hypothetical protein